jgi:hypothetical protein
VEAFRAGRLQTLMGRSCCALLPGNSPESGAAGRRPCAREARPRRAYLAPLALAVAVTCAACSGSARAVRLPVPPGSPDIFRVSCDKRISACREKAEQVCGGSYQVLESTGASIEPERVSSSGPRYTGPRYQRAKWVGQLVIACGAPPAPGTPDPLLAGSAAPQTSSEQRAPVLAPGQLCIPGVTLACLGPGACRGAQACLTDGRGYGPCDCGDGDAESPAALPSRPAHHADAGTTP